MSARAIQRLSLFTWRLPLVYRCSSGTPGGESKDGGPGAPKKPSTVESAAAPAPPPTPPVPEEKFDNSKYQAGQLYEYTAMSFYDMELDMSPARCPQPSSLKKPS